MYQKKSTVSAIFLPSLPSDLGGGKERGSDFPGVTVYCQVSSSNEKNGDDKITDRTWVPQVGEQRSNGEADEQ